MNFGPSMMEPSFWSQPMPEGAIFGTEVGLVLFHRALCSHRGDYPSLYFSSPLIGCTWVNTVAWSITFPVVHTIQYMIFLCTLCPASYQVQSAECLITGWRGYVCHRIIDLGQLHCLRISSRCSQKFPELAPNFSDTYRCIAPPTQ